MATEETGSPMTTKVERARRLLDLLSRDRSQIAANLTFDDVACVPGWSFMRGPRADEASYYVSTPTQPRPSIRHAVPPFEHVFTRGELLDFLVKRWIPDAQEFIDRRSRAAMRAAVVTSPHVNGSHVPVVEMFSRETLDVAAKRWAPGIGHTWHRVGAEPEATLDLSKAREAPPVGSKVCAGCLEHGAHLRDDDTSDP